MYQVGIVSEVDLRAGTARVTFEELDGLVTDFLPVLQLGTRVDKSYWLPDTGEHVACLMDENYETGVVLGAVYNDEDKPAESGAGLRSLQVFKGRAAVFKASVSRALNGAFKLWNKGATELETEDALTVTAGKAAKLSGETLEFAAGGGNVKISRTGRLSYSANGGNLHKVLQDIAKFLATHKHVVAGAATTVLSPDDITKAATLALEIEKILED